MIAYIHKKFNLQDNILLNSAHLRLLNLLGISLYNVMVCAYLWRPVDQLYLCLQLVFATTCRVCCVQASLGALWSSGCTAEATESKKWSTIGRACVMCCVSENCVLHPLCICVYRFHPCTTYMYTHSHTIKSYNIITMFMQIK